MKQTSNYSLNKPEGTDTVNIDDLNANFDSLDTELKKVSDKANLIQTAGGTGTAITLNNVSLVNGFTITFVVLANNSGAATTINGKALYKPGTTIAPTLTAGKAVTVWYNGTAFFIKASAEGDADVASVLAGKKFSNDNDTGLTGAMPNNGAVNITPGTANQVIPAGYHNGSGIVAGDADLVTANIKAGVNIFGVAGKTSVVDTTEATNPIAAASVLSGKIGFVNGAKITGTIVSKSAATITPSTTDQTIATGQYLNGAQTIKGDANLLTGNIKAGVSIFGVAGNSNVVDTSSGDAVATDLLSGKKAYVDGALVTGTATAKAAATITPGTSDQTLAAGLHLTGTQTIKGDANLVGANILSGKSVFGVVGTFAPKSPNLIVNGSFESGTANWFLSGIYVNLLTGASKSGSNSINLQGNGADGSYGMMTYLVNIKSGHKYYASCWCYRWESIAASSTGQFDICDGGLTSEMDFANLNDSAFPAFAWTLVSNIVTAPSNATNASLRMFTWSTAALAIDCVMLIDLTDWFGSGNEPTKATMDVIVNSKGGWWDSVDAPTAISGLAATVGYSVSGRVGITYTAPSDGRTKGVRILYKTGGYPTSPTGGTVCYDSNDAIINTSLIIDGLVDGTTYYFTAFAWSYQGATRIYSGYIAGSQVTALPLQTQGIQTFTSSGTFTVPAGVVSIDIFAVGGGTGGNNGGSGVAGGGGGGAGYTTTRKAYTVTPGQQYAVVVGAGGSGGYNTSISPSGVVGVGGAGGVSSFGGSVLVANGGEAYYGSVDYGGNGGSGGGGYYSNAGGAGGSNGSNGSLGYYQGGTGQGTTTRAFGEAGNTLYAGGGGGAAIGAGGAGGGGTGGQSYGGNGGAGSANTGGGGGGALNTYYGGVGGSGIVIVRWGF